MKVFSISDIAKAFCLTCIWVCAFSAQAQTQDTLQVDTLNAQKVNLAPVSRPKPMSFRMGSIRSNAILRQMPQYKAIQNNMIALREQYEAEAKKSEKDFQRKFEEFMQGQKDFPKTILEKRQNELESMLETNAAFRIKVQALLAEAEKSMIADVKAELADAIEIAAQERGVSIVFDLDNGSVPYVVGGLTIDLTPHVLKVLGIDPSNN